MSLPLNVKKAKKLHLSWAKTKGGRIEGGRWGWMGQGRVGGGNGENCI